MHATGWTGLTHSQRGLNTNMRNSNKLGSGDENISAVHACKDVEVYKDLAGLDCRLEKRARDSEVAGHRRVQVTLLNQQGVCEQLYFQSETFLITFLGRVTQASLLFAMIFSKSSYVLWFSGLASS